MKSTIIIYLIELAGTGKYTIAKEIAQHNYKIIDNHLIDNPIFSLLDFNEPKVPDFAWQAIRKIREIVFDFSLNLESNLIFTNELLNNSFDIEIFKKVLKLAEAKCVLFIPVRLLISEEERNRRLIVPERSVRFKMIKDHRIKQGEQLKLLEIAHPNLLNLEVTSLSAQAAAAKILEFTSLKLKDKL